MRSRTPDRSRAVRTPPAGRQITVRAPTGPAKTEARPASDALYHLHCQYSCTSCDLDYCRSGSGCSAVLVDHTVEDLSSPYRGIDGDDGGRVVVRRVLVEPLVSPVTVEVVFVLAEYGAGVSFVVDQQAVGAFGPDAS